VNEAATTLRRLLQREQTWFIPGCFDALSALMVRQAGFEFAFISGYGIAATHIGGLDVGLLTRTDVSDAVRRICDAVPALPLIADADDGYGDAMSVRTTVTQFIRAGAAAIVLEDQATPKRCGHMSGKQVLSRNEARMKIRAAIDAREALGSQLVIVARTDALAPLGLDEALQRVREFEEEGADVLFIDALESEGQMRAFCKAVERPTWLNSFPGGRTPCLPRAKIIDMGFRIVIDPTPIFSVTRALQLHLKALAAGDDSAFPPRVSFREMGLLLGLQQHDALAKRYEVEASP
jgi:2-methylisocitrate lyase-like PEP mutase family enzyme